MNGGGGRTGVVSAAAGGVASHPATLVDRHRPAVPLLALQRVGRQVAHLQLCEVSLEIIERHPGRTNGKKEGKKSKSPDNLLKQTAPV